MGRRQFEFAKLATEREKEAGTWWQGQWWAAGCKETVPKQRLEELAETIAKIAVDLDPAEQGLIKTLIRQIAARWRENIIPDTLLGYHLLISSQLSPSERSTVIGTTQIISPSNALGTVSPIAAGINLNRVEVALMNSWQDKELMEKDENESRKAAKQGEQTGKSICYGRIWRFGR